MLTLVMGPVFLLGLATDLRGGRVARGVHDHRRRGATILGAHDRSASREQGTSRWRAITGRTIEQRARQVTAEAPDRDRLLVVCNGATPH